MRSLLVMLTLAAGSASSASCDPARFKHALSESAKAPLDPRLPGVWAGRIGDAESTLHFVPRDDGRLDVALVAAAPKDGATLLAYEGTPATVGGRLYMNLREKRYTDAFNNKYELTPGYLLMRIDFEPNGAFVVSSPTNETVEAAGKALHTEAKTRFVTDEVAALGAWVAKPEGAAAFKRMGRFAKANLDYGPLATPTP